MRARVRARRAFLDLFTDLYWRLLAVVVTPAWSVGNERLVDLKFYLRCLAKNVGDFLKNVGDFSENVGDFLWEVRSEGPEGRKVLQAQWRMRQSQCRAKG